MIWGPAAVPPAAAGVAGEKGSIHTVWWWPIAAAADTRACRRCGMMYEMLNLRRCQIRAIPLRVEACKIDF